MEAYIDNWPEITARGGYSQEFVKQAKESRIRALKRQEEEQALDIMRARCIPIWAREIICHKAEEEGVSPLEVLNAARHFAVVRARNAALYEIKNTRKSLSCPQLGKWFAKDHTSILHGIAKHAWDNALPKLVGMKLPPFKGRPRVEIDA